MAKSPRKDNKPEEHSDPELPNPALPRDLELPSDEHDEAQETRELNAVLKAENLAGGTIRLERRGPLDQNFSYLCKIRIENFDIEQIKKMYGGGDYMGMCFRANGQMGKKVAFSIDPRFKGAVEELPKTSGGDDASTSRIISSLASVFKPDPAAGAMQARMMETLQANNQQMIAMMQQSNDKTMQMMIAMMSNMATISAAKPVVQDTGLKEILPLLIALMQGNQSKSNNIEEVIKAVKELRGLAEAGTEASAATPPTLMQQLTDMLPHVASTISALKGNPTPPAAATPAALPESGTASIKSSRPTPVARPSGDNNAQLRALALMLVSAGKRGSDVELYSDVVLDNLTPEEEPVFKLILTGDSWFESIFAQIPEAVTVKPWLEQLRANLLTILNEPDPSTVSPDKPQATGDENPSGVRSE